MALQSFTLHKELWDALPAEPGIEYNGRIMSILKVALDPANSTICGPLWEPSTTHGSRDSPPSGWSVKMFWPWNRALPPRSSAGSGRWATERWTGWSLPRRWLPGRRKWARRWSRAAWWVPPGNGKVESVVTNDGEIACGAVLIAAGPWCRTAEQWLDIAIPVDPLKGQIIRLRPDGPGWTTSSSAAEVPCNAKPDGLIWCGATEEEVGFDLSLTDEGRDTSCAGRHD